MKNTEIHNMIKSFFQIFSKIGHIFGTPCTRNVKSEFKFGFSMFKLVWVLSFVNLSSCKHSQIHHSMLKPYFFIIAKIDRDFGTPCPQKVKSEFEFGFSMLKLV